MKKNPFAYYGKKLAVFAAGIILLSVAVFYLSRLVPGDPLMSYYGERTEKMSVEEKIAARDRLGLNEPLHNQYIRWVENAFSGDFGISYKYKQDVLEVIGDRAGNTLVLGGIGFILTFLGALGIGILCAWNEDSWLDRLLCKCGTLISCVPEFWLSLVMILMFSVVLHIFPSSGAYDVGKKGDVLNRVWHLILPLAAVVLQHLWYYAYMVRNKLLEEIREDYVLLAKAKGLSKGKIVFHHCLRNIMPGYISIMAVSIPHILGGTYVVEKVFGYPGIGTLAFESARYHDYNLLMLICLLTGVLVIFSNITGQIINEHIDPRIKMKDGVKASEVGRL